MSQTTRSKTEFLGLHDPFADLPAGPAGQPRKAAPLLDKEKASELVRAGTTLTVIFLLVAVAITALY